MQNQIRHRAETSDPGLKFTWTGKYINLPIGEANHENKVTRLKAYSASIEWYANILMRIRNAARKKYPNPTPPPKHVNAHHDKRFILDVPIKTDIPASVTGKNVLNLFVKYVHASGAGGFIAPVVLVTAYKYLPEELTCATIYKIGGIKLAGNPVSVGPLCTKKSCSTTILSSNSSNQVKLI